MLMMKIKFVEEEDDETYFHDFTPPVLGARASRNFGLISTEHINTLKNITFH